jgi:hypothetical protein
METEQRIHRDSVFPFFFYITKNYQKLRQAPVAHTCIPRYSIGRNQEDHSLRPAQESNFKTLS